MRSPTNWALLALVIERPGYAYELTQRFKRRYADVLPLSSNSQIYSALDALTDRALVEELAGSSEARQPKPHYRATEQGRHQFEAWLIQQAQEAQRLHGLLMAQLLALKGLATVGEILDGQKQVWREGLAPQTAAGDDDACPDSAVRVLEEGRRLIAEANLSWLELARDALEHRRRPLDSASG